MAGSKWIPSQLHVPLGRPREGLLMEKEIYQVDGDGFIEEVFLGEFDDEGNLKGIFLGKFYKDVILIDADAEYVTIDLPQPLPFYRPRFNGAQWVEGISVEEITKLKQQQLLENLKPSVEEIMDADLEVKILTMLIEMEVIE